MTKIVYFGIFLVLVSNGLSFAQKQSPQYAVSLVVASSNKQDSEIVYRLAKEHLKERCRFFDTEHHRNKIREFYRANPQVKAGDVLGKVKDLELKTKLVIPVECSMNITRDQEFPVWYHSVHLEMRVVDNDTSEEYALENASSGRIFLPLSSGEGKDWQDKESWQKHGKARELAIQKALEPAVGKLLQQLDQWAEKIEIHRQLVGVVVEDLSSQEQSKLEKALVNLQDDGEIQIEKRAAGERYLFGKVRLLKSQDLFSFQQVLREACQMEGLSVVISSDIGQVFVSARR